MKGKIFVFRGDAGFETGMGHLNRLAATARLLAEGGAKVVVALASTPPAIEGSHILSGLETMRVAPGLSIDEEPGFIDSAISARHPGLEKRLVVSGYEFKRNSCFAAFRRLGWKTAFFDDLNLFAADCDVVINANFFSSEMGYEKTYRGTGTKLLLGPEYYLLRAEFADRARAAGRAPRRGARDRGAKKRVLVTMGGSDFFNLTPKVVRALDGADGDFSITVLAGATNRRVAEIEKLSRRGLSHELKIIYGAGASGAGDIARIFSDCDIAVTSGGGTIYEMIYLQKPFISFPLTANERMNAASAAKKGLCLVVATNRLASGVAAERLSPNAETKFRKHFRLLLDSAEYNKIKSEMAAISGKYFDGSRLAAEIAVM